MDIATLKAKLSQLFAPLQRASQRAWHFTLNHLSPRVLAFLRKHITPKRLHIAWITAGVLIVLYGLALGVALPYWLKPFAEKQIEQQLGRKTSIGKLAINPYFLSVTIQNFRIYETDAQTPMVDIGEIYVNASIWSAIRQAAILDEIKITKPTISFARLSKDRFSFSDIIDKLKAASAAAPKPTEPSKPVHFSLNNIQLIDGTIAFNDQVSKKHHRIDQLNFALPFISDLPHDVDIFVAPALSARVNGSPLDITSQAKPFNDTLETTLNITLNELDIPTYMGLVPVQIDYFPTSGKLDTKLVLKFRQTQGQPPQVRLTGDVAVNKLAINVRPQKTPAVKVERIALYDIDYVMTANFVRVGRFIILAPSVIVKRDSNGQLNLLPPANNNNDTNAAGVSSADAETPAPASAVQTTDAETTSAPEDKKPAISFMVENFNVNKGTIDFTDDFVKKPVHVVVAPWQFSAKQITADTNTEIPFGFNTQINQRGTLSINGTAVPVPLAVTANIDLDRLGLPAVQGYVTSTMNANLASLDLATHGTLKVQQQAAAPDAAQNAGSATPAGLQIAWLGDTTLSDLAVTDGKDAVPFVRWKSLSVRHVDVQLPPGGAPVADIGAITLANLDARFVKDADGMLNLNRALANPDAPPASDATADDKTPASDEAKKDEAKKETKENKNAGSAPVIRLGKFELTNSHVGFADRTVQPNYITNLTNMHAMIGHVASDKPAPAPLAWGATLDGDGALNMSGTINPLTNPIFLNMALVTDNIELTRLTPYTAKFAGYPINKGKLQLNLKYHIEQNKLDAGNHVFIDQLTFGDHTDSPDATHLPVLLAVSLLTDTNNQINIDLPITGDLSDPSFKFGHIILQVLVNLLTKAATSPFALLGAAFGGGDELGHADFTVGTAALDSAQQTRLDKLAQALSARPNLKLDIAGRVDPASDLLPLKTRLQKLHELQIKSADASADSVTVGADEYPKYLKKAYDAADIPNKPRDFLGVAQEIPQADMEKLLLAGTPTTDIDLHNLAMQRAAHVRDYLTDHNIPTDRIFIDAPHVGTDGLAAGDQPNRADFTLK